MLIHWMIIGILVVAAISGGFKGLAKAVGGMVLIYVLILAGLVYMTGYASNEVISQQRANPNQSYNYCGQEDRFGHWHSFPCAH